MPVPPPAVARPRTKQEYVYQTLRSGIMRCEIAPGERLVIDDVARTLQVSIIPVREALQLLQSEGLILNIPHVGATVAPITRESILDVFSVLEGVGSVATRLVAERGDPAELDLLGTLVSEMDEDLVNGRLEHWAEVNTRFHLEIGAMPGLRMLHETTARVLDSWRRVRHYYFEGVLQLRVSQAQQEHREMLAAMRMCDVVALAHVVRRHSQGALAAYLGFLDEGLARTTRGAQAAIT